MTALPASGSFAMVDPTHVAAVGPAAAILFARITWRAEQSSGSWRATIRTLVDETGLTPKMIRTASRVLRDSGWVVTERTSPDDATLIWKPSVSAGQADSAQSAPPPAQSGGTPPAQSAISSFETGRDNPLPPDGGLFGPPDAPPLRSVPTPAELDAEFARFWSLYPRRTGKKAARTAYGRARRTATVQAIATGLRAQLPSMAATDPAYLPHPTTWLNQGRWEDELLPAARRPAVASPDETYDPSYAAALPPPPKRDLYA